MSIESVMPSSHLMLCHPLLLLLQSSPASGSFQMSQFFAAGGQSIGISASASVPPMIIQDLFPLVWTGIYHHVYMNIVHYQAKWYRIILLPIFDFLCFMESFLNLIFILYWSIVDLQCCVSFRRTAKWISCTYTCIYFFSDSFPI